MKSETLGKSTSLAEITNISRHGLWLLTDDKELFMSYKDFPWFKEASIGQVLHVVEPTPGHFHWPDLDVDLTAEIIEHPENYPLRAS